MMISYTIINNFHYDKYANHYMNSLYLVNPRLAYMCRSGTCTVITIVYTCVHLSVTMVAATWFVCGPKKGFYDYFKNFD